MYEILYLLGWIGALGFLFGVLGGIAEYAMSKSKKLNRWFDSLPLNMKVQTDNNGNTVYLEIFDQVDEYDID